MVNKNKAVEFTKSNSIRNNETQVKLDMYPTEKKKRKYRITEVFRGSSFQVGHMDTSCRLGLRPDFTTDVSAEAFVPCMSLPNS
jgi:hypothetical protein